MFNALINLFNSFCSLMIFFVTLRFNLHSYASFNYFYTLDNIVFMPDIAGNISLIKSQLPSSVKLVAVSKTKPVSDVMEAYNTGQKCFGENRVQEMLNKKDLLPADLEWHLIGHLQSNKVRYIVPFIAMIQSIDTFKLLSVVNMEASKVSRVIDCLLQVHIAKEETKYGFSTKELTEMVVLKEFNELKNIRVCGLMGMATYTTDTELIRNEFKYLASCFETLKLIRFAEVPHFKEISMGMSGDFKIAVEEGSTIVRIGSKIFGER